MHVFVEGFKGPEVYVFGRVMKPGTMAYESGMSLIEVITKAGGLHDLAAAERTTITRVIDGKEVSGVSVKAIRQGVAKNVAVYPGDIVFVRRACFDAHTSSPILRPCGAFSNECPLCVSVFSWAFCSTRSVPSGWMLKHIGP